MLLREVPNQHCRDPASLCRPAGDYKREVMIDRIHIDLDFDDIDIEMRCRRDREMLQR